VRGAFCSACGGCAQRCVVHCHVVAIARTVMLARCTAAGMLRWRVRRLVSGQLARDVAGNTWIAVLARGCKVLVVECAFGLSLC
jgi:hypothetical protein